MDQQAKVSLRVLLAIPILVAATLFLGTWAWLDQKQSVPDALYRTLALFAYNDVYGGGSTYLQQLGWQFQVARWLGIAAVFSAATTAVTALLHEHIVYAVARYVRQPVVVIGQHAIAEKAFDLGERTRRRVLWLGAPAIGSHAYSSVAIPWPTGDPAEATLAYSRNGDHILIAESNDAQAVALARSARRAAPNAFITVLMSDSRLAEDAAATFDQARTRVMSRGDLAARALHRRHPPFLIAQRRQHERISALIIGFGQIGQAIMRDLIVNCRTTFLGRPHLTIIDPNAHGLEGAVKLRAPEIGECARLNFVTGRLASDAVEPDQATLTKMIETAAPITVAYVCLETDTQTLNAAMTLQALFRLAGLAEVPIFVRLRQLDIVENDPARKSGLDSLTPFGELEHVLASSEFLSTRPDAAARAFAEAYRAALPPELRDDPKNASAREWDDLAESFRQANRDAVAHIPAKVASAGVDPALWIGDIGIPRLTDDQRLFTTPEECERLAELEHERWNAQRRMAGWRHTDAVSKNELLRLHPSLVAYEQLSDETKEYDRVFVRETAAALAEPRSGKS